MDQGAAEPQLLFHAAGQGTGATLDKRLQTAHLQQSLSPCGPFPLWHTKDVGMEADVFHHRQIRIQPKTLAHVTDMGTDRLQIMTGAAQHRGLTAAGIQYPGQHPQGRGLACTVRPHQTEQLSRGDVESQAVHSGQCVEAFGEIGEFNSIHQDKSRRCQNSDDTKAVRRKRRRHS